MEAAIFELVSNLLSSFLVLVCALVGISRRQAAVMRDTICTLWPPFCLSVFPTTTTSRVASDLTNSLPTVVQSK